MVIVLPLYSTAQKENNVWEMGCELPNHNSEINFNSGLPDTSTVVREMCFFLTNSSICDTSGQLLFYTNGCSVNNRNYDSLYNSSGFNPGWLTDYYQPFGMGLPQGCFIIPRPGHYGEYYLFHESGELVTMKNGLTVSQATKLMCSKIDMSLDGGSGGIDPSFKNVTVINDTLIYGRVTGVKHANGRDWWIIAHRSDSDLYYKLLVTPDTMMLYSQNIGRPHNLEVFTQQCVFDPTGTKYAIELTVDTTIAYGNTIDLLDFDRCTGVFSNARSVIVPDSLHTAGGCSFSSNSRFLYVSNPYFLFQFDTWDINFNASVKTVGVADSLGTSGMPLFYFHLLAPDGKIYVTPVISYPLLHYINSPDQLDTLCDFVQNSFFLPALNNACMPNAPNYSLGAETGSVCDSLTGVLSIMNQVSRPEIYPNPNNGNFIVSYVLPQNKDGTLEITNTLGEVVYRQRLPQWSSMQRIQLKNVAEGVYSCIIKSNGSMVIGKLVVAGK